MSARDQVTVFAPATIGNCAVGFDILGHSLCGPGDSVVLSFNDTGIVRIVDIVGAEIDGGIDLPRQPERNTAGGALQALLPHAGDRGFDVRIHKGIALGSGMGGSAASAVAAVVAANALLDGRLDIATLYAAAKVGEAIASGAAHGDNVGPALLGGLVIATSQGAPVRIDVPKWLHIGLVRPHFNLDTRVSRAVLAGSYSLAAFTQQTECLALVLAGCQQNDALLIRRGLRDLLIEPQRAPLIPGFGAVQAAAMDCGALGASIAGGGPSVFGWFPSAAQAESGVAAMRAAFTGAGLDSSGLVSPVDGPRAGVVA